jgi:hypothetical protein
MPFNPLATSVAAGALLIVTSAAAQQAQQTQQGQQTQIAEQCLQDMRELSREMVEAGYGIGGPAGYGVADPAAMGDPAVAGDPVAIGAPGGYGAAAPAGGWYGTYGPRRGMNTVLAAAEVFALNGREEACQNVLAELRDMHEERLAQLEEAGISPDEVRGWRQELLIQAQPVGELGGTIRIDNVLGSDLRNLQDEDLGDIEDVVLDEQGNLAYVLVGRGGFFGLGRDLVPVRWQDLRAVPGADTFVLNVDEETFEQAPAVDRDRFADTESYGQRREEIDSYWDQQLQG